METTASINYEKTYGKDVVPSNMLINITDKKHVNYGKTYGQVISEILNSGKGKKIIKETKIAGVVDFGGIKVGPEILSFDSYQSPSDFEGRKVNESGTELESYTPKTRKPSTKKVIPSGVEYKMTDLSEFRYSDAETKKFQETPDKILVNTPEFKAQHESLKNMFPNTQHPENLVKLTLRY